MALRTLLFLSLVACFGHAHAQQSTLSWSVTGTSDYVFRGISQNDEHPALQAGATWNHSSGFYAGTWGSQVDFGPGSGADLEIDAFFGYRRAVSSKWTLDVQLLRYIYPGTHADLDFNELIGVASYSDRFKLTAAWSNDEFNTSESGLYLGANAILPLPHGFSADFGVGHYAFDEAVFGGDTDDYSFWSAGLNRSFGRVAVSLVWYGTDDAAERLFGPFAGDRAVLSATANF